MRKGNCLIYALGMWLVEGCTGRIEPAILKRWPPKLRFYYVNERGERTYYVPDHPKRGWRACWDSLWYQGHVRKGKGEE